MANVASRQIEQAMFKGGDHLSVASLQTVKKATPDIKNLQQNFTLVLFFRSTCPHCHRFVPILKDFVHYYHVRLIAYSTDGKDIDGLHAKAMTGREYKDYFVQGGFRAVVPALFLQNLHTGQTYAVLFGEATPGQLASRMNDLLKHIQQQEEKANA